MFFIDSAAISFPASDRSLKHSGGTKHETTLLLRARTASFEGSRAITDGDIPDRLRRHVTGTIPPETWTKHALRAREARADKVTRLKLRPDATCLACFAARSPKIVRHVAGRQNGETKIRSRVCPTPDSMFDRSRERGLTLRKDTKDILHKRLWRIWLISMRSICLKSRLNTATSCITTKILIRFLFIVRRNKSLHLIGLKILLWINIRYFRKENNYYVVKVRTYIILKKMLCW